MTAREREELVAAIFVDRRAEPAARCLAWMVDEPRFATFLQVHREKIRKKARNASGAEGLRDLLAELEIAHHLLRERRFDLAYEAYAAAKAGGPDFTVTYKGHIAFNVEVKRLRTQSPQASISSGIQSRWRLVDAVCDKLRQMPPSSANIVAILTEHTPDQTDLAAALRSLVARAEHADAALFARHGFSDTRDFFAGFRRLSAIWVRHSAEAAASVLWQNPQASHPLHPDLPALVARDHVGSG